MLKKLPIVITLLVIVIAAGGCGPKKVHSVKFEAEANQMLDVLGEYGIRASKEETGEGERKQFNIMVESQEDFAAAIQLLEDHCLGRPEPPEPDGSAVIKSLETERQSERRAMKMNIEAQLKTLPGVICPSVNFVPAQDPSLVLEPNPSTASVTIHYKTPTFPYSKEELTLAVARSVPGLKPENVNVILAAKPIRPRPENRLGYNVARIALVGGIGAVAVVGFLSAVFLLRRKRSTPVEPAAPPESVAEPSRAEPPLLDDFDDDDDDDEDLRS